MVTPVVADVDGFEPDIAEIPSAGPMPMIVESPDHQEMPEEEEEPPASIEIDHQIDHSFETDDALDMVEA